ncbi:MAG: Bax inhibitor-1 family protein, partial [Pseudomonas sp.]
HTSVHRQDDRHGSSHLLSRRWFIALTAFYIVVGLLWTAVCANWAASALNADSYVPIALLAFGFAMIGAVASARAESSVGSLFGFAMMATGLGVICGPALALYSLGSILLALLGTTLVVVVLGLVGALIPASLEGWWPYLMWATLMLVFGLLLVPSLIATGFLGAGAMGGLSWAVLLVFSLWVVYDLNRAMALERNYRNAADVAAAIYLDFLNIFLSILDLFGSAGSGIKGWWNDGDSGSSSGGGKPDGWFGRGSGSGGSWLDW